MSSRLVLVASLLFATSVAAQGKPKFEFAPETVEKSGPPSRTLQKALKLYENKDYYSASIELHKVIEGETGDSPANKQRAEFWMGKTLYHLGFFSASLSYFDRIVQKGDAHRYYAATLKWLASLSRKLPESVGILKKIGKYSRVQLEQPALEKVKYELYYLLGRYHYTTGNFKDAVALFGAVPSNSSFFARAKFMEGITHIRQYKAKPAAGAFKILLRTARESPDASEIRQFEELSLLSLARIFYSTGQFDLSIKYYNQLPHGSRNWLPALFESSWAQFQRQHFAKALGNIHTLNAPFFEERSFPESLILKAVVYWKHCLWQRSQDAIDEFKGKYPKLQKQVDSIVNQYNDPTEFYGYADKIRKSQAGLSRDVGRLVRGALSDRTLEKTFEFVAELDRELKQVQGADPAWKATAIAGVILQDLMLQRSLAQRDAGDLAQRRLKRLSGEIKELLKQAIKVEYEIINGQKNELEATVRGELVIGAGKRQARDFVPNDEQHYWPFRKEFWRDELGYYLTKIRSRCTR
ncbi:MAG: hypothetical protein H6707_03175 [Deltaproteobacteria bacterium]|nr:hypothetical protein [Deltaproteobacteria bacterium]